MHIPRRKRAVAQWIALVATSTNTCGRVSRAMAIGRPLSGRARPARGAGGAQGSDARASVASGESARAAKRSGSRTSWCDASIAAMSGAAPKPRNTMCNLSRNATAAASSAPLAGGVLPDILVTVAGAVFVDGAFGGFRTGLYASCAPGTSTGEPRPWPPWPWLPCCGRPQANRPWYLYQIFSHFCFSTTLTNCWVIEDAAKITTVHHMCSKTDYSQKGVLHLRVLFFLPANAVHHDLAAQNIAARTQL
jgi:hypothetical protein